MPEVHLVGEILGGAGFTEKSRLFCKWEIVFDQKDSNKQNEIDRQGNWEVLRGSVTGQTQIDITQPDIKMKEEEGLEVIWSHPIGIQLSSTSVFGWPRVYVEVWHCDEYERRQLRGYGFCHVPMSPGSYTLDCVTWAPTGSWIDKLTSVFLGEAPVLDTPRVVYSCGNRFELSTRSSGIVYVKLNVLCSGFQELGAILSDESQ